MIIEIHPYDGNENNVGLANKLRAILSSIRYCELNSYKLNVKWNYFYKLFPSIIENEIFTVIPGDVKIYPLFYPIGESNNTYGGFPGNVDVEYYSSNFPFERLFNLLIPNSHLKDDIENYQQKFIKTKTFGVHLRLGDFVEFSKSNNYYIPSIDDYILKIDELLNDYENFYFTTDDCDAYDKIKVRYHDRVCFIENKNLDRNNENNFYYAFLDMVLLSKTKIILGNKYSTFSYHAARIGNIELLSIEK